MAMKPRIIVIIVVAITAIAVFVYFHRAAVGPANTIHVSGDIEATEVRL
jgi:hypothetical protein